MALFGLFARPTPTVATVATPAQLGNAAMPAAHTDSAIPGVIDVKGDELPDLLGAQPTSSRAWLGAQTLGQMQGHPDTGAAGTTTAADHRLPGTPDPRRVWGSDSPAGEHAGPIGPDAELRRPQTETLANFRTPVVITPAPAPTRPRAGSTGEDPAAPAQQAGWMFLRAFDKWAADEFSAGRISWRGPVASQPLAYAGVIPGALPSPGGDGPTEPLGQVSAQPNSVRLLPRAWDEQLINPGQTAPIAQLTEQTRRAGGWRAAPSLGAVSE